VLGSAGAYLGLVTHLYTFHFKKPLYSMALFRTKGIPSLECIQWLTIRGIVRNVNWRVRNAVVVSIYNSHCIVSLSTLIHTFNYVPMFEVKVYNLHRLKLFVINKVQLLIVTCLVNLTVHETYAT